MTEAAPPFDATFIAQLDAVLRWRRDVRHFERRPLPEEEVSELLRSACLAPSVGNSQPWRFVRLRSAELRTQLASHIDGQSKKASRRYGGQQRADYVSLKLHAVREAPELMAVFCDERPKAGHGLGIATMPEMLRYSTVLAIHNLWLAARARGIGVGWVSILDPQAVAATINVPADWTLIALLCIGYAEEDSDTPELERRGWQAREPWADRVFER